MSGLKLLLEGPPRVGKSTVLARVAAILPVRGVAVSGFIAEEIRVDGERVGFRMRSLDGGDATFAHVDYPGPIRVGRYGVDLAALERIALPAMDVYRSVLLVDELARMELASAAFRERATAVFGSTACVVATVHAFAHQFTDDLKKRDDVSVVSVTELNRDRLPEEIADLVLAEFRCG